MVHGKNGMQMESDIPIQITYMEIKRVNTKSGMKMVCLNTTDRIKII